MAGLRYGRRVCGVLDQWAISYVGGWWGAGDDSGRRVVDECLGDAAARARSSDFVEPRFGRWGSGGIFPSVALGGTPPYCLRVTPMFAMG